MITYKEEYAEHIQIVKNIHLAFAQIMERLSMKINELLKVPNTTWKIFPYFINICVQRHDKSQEQFEIYHLLS